MPAGGAPVGGPATDTGGVPMGIPLSPGGAGSGSSGGAAAGGGGGGVSSGGSGAAPRRFSHQGPDGWEAHSEVQSHIIAEAMASEPQGGVVPLPGAPFQVRWGLHATSAKMTTAPPSGIIQVNTKSGATRVVREESGAPPPLAAAAAPPAQFFHQAPGGVWELYTPEQCQLIEAAVRAAPAAGVVGLPGIPFEVRWGSQAVSARMSVVPSSGMCQVNLSNENTRIARDVSGWRDALLQQRYATVTLPVDGGSDFEWTVDGVQRKLRAPAGKRKGDVHEFTIAASAGSAAAAAAPPASARYSHRGPGGWEAYSPEQCGAIERAMAAAPAGGRLKLDLPAGLAFEVRWGDQAESGKMKRDHCKTGIMQVNLSNENTREVRKG